MTKQIFLRRWFGTGLVVVLLLAISGLLSAYSRTDESRQRPDIITITLDAAPGSPEMPTVQFFHDRHTEVLKEKDCSACHPKKDQKLVFKFKRTQDSGYDKDMAVYHDNCIGCHTEVNRSGKESGPLTGDCRSCHARDPGTESSRRPIAFDKSLHYRHASAQAIPAQPTADDGNCAACHHKYDKTVEKTVYIKGEEESCRYCHKPQRAKEARSIQAAAHDACVNCHQRVAANSRKAGPVNCTGCHAAAAQKKIEIVETVPRIKRNQPDVVLLVNWLNKPEVSPADAQQHMQPAAFNHIGHENDAQTCRACHHETLKRCGECHTQNGSDKGGFVRLEQAMHRDNSDRSCIGCHREKQAKADCAGCHAAMPRGRRAETNCTLCHAVEKQALNPLPLSGETRTLVAKTNLQNRSVAIPIPGDDLVPEEVKIGLMVDQYEHALFPHRRIVKELAARIEKSRMATSFHRQDTTLCAGCHHNSPASVQPPKCASCHGKPFQTATDGRPGLKGAYHTQCIGCHQRMGIEKPVATACTECHKKRSQTAS